MQASPTLRRAADRFFHWCPACELLHPLPDSWTFNGDVARPTFAPSFKQTLGDGRVCHYFIVDGEIRYCGDCSHGLAGTTVTLPELPPHLRD